MIHFDMYTIVKHLSSRLVQDCRLATACDKRLHMITPEQSRGARGLLNWSQVDLAEAARIGIVTVRQFELGNTTPRFVTLQAMRKVLEDAGVIFVDANGDGPGVRLRKKPKATGK